MMAVASSSAACESGDLESSRRALFENDNALSFCPKF